MDGDKASWILEFLLRQPLEDWLANALLSHLPIPLPLDPHLKKTLLRRRLSVVRLSDDTLLSLELLEELDRTLGAAPASEALKAAYSAVAAELTASPLRLGSRDNFLEAVDCIWNCRVAHLERSEARGMVGEGLRKWRWRMEEAAVSDAAREWVLGWDTKGEAVAALKEYVRVVLKEMGPPLLELAARAMGGKPDAGCSLGTHQEAGEREAVGMPGVSVEPRVALGAPTTEFSHLDRPAPETDGEGIRPSLFDRNPTARTYEWDEDSIEVSPDNLPNSSKRPHLPTPRNRRLSPLQLQDFKKLVRRSSTERVSSPSDLSRDPSTRLPRRNRQPSGPPTPERRRAVELLEEFEGEEGVVGEADGGEAAEE